ncbi:hypothetical protein [Bacillus amyloliquefaciens]|uniref:hypothetical protein n=1 Tax=Bacillus amyloliquefaciens TaxID=1390 RepID=UPI000395E876|nr:hypothetical protein [Bacillus amyloliquefaciens]ERH55263.1 hypothetical protein O205_21440 [Bacillus amyloliquefaciens EGD-AQ14]
MDKSTYINDMKDMIIENENLKKSEEQWKGMFNAVEDTLNNASDLFRDYLIEKGQKDDFLQFVISQIEKNKAHYDYIDFAKGMLADE